MSISITSNDFSKVSQNQTHEKAEKKTHRGLVPRDAYSQASYLDISESSLALSPCGKFIAQTLPGKIRIIEVLGLEKNLQEANKKNKSELEAKTQKELNGSQKKGVSEELKYQEAIYTFTDFNQDREHFKVDSLDENIWEMIWSFGAAPVLFVTLRKPHPDVGWSVGSSLWAIRPWERTVVRVGGWGTDSAEETFLVGLSKKHPNRALFSDSCFAISDYRDTAIHQYNITENTWDYEVITSRGQKRYEFRDTFSAFYFDEDFNLKIAYSKNYKHAGEETFEVFKYDENNGKLISIFSTVYQLPNKISLLHYSPEHDPNNLYFTDNRHPKHNFSVAKALDLETGDVTTKVVCNEAGIRSLIPSNKPSEFLAYFTNKYRPEIHYIENSNKELTAILKKFMDFIGYNQFDFSRPFDFTVSADPFTEHNFYAVLPDPAEPGNFMLVAVSRTDLPNYQKLLTFDSGIPKAIFTTHEPTEIRIIKTSDNLELCCYIKKPAKDLNLEMPCPFVVMIHGGPRARDYFEYHPMAELFANRGIGTLSVNYRGSTGFGKDLCLKGNGEWSRKMLDDIETAVKTLQQEGTMHRKKVIACGFSYGASAVYGLLAFKPELFMAGIAGAGDADFIKTCEIESFSGANYWSNLMVAAPFYTKKDYPYVKNETTCKLLSERSPIHFAANIKVPLLIMSGDKDGVVAYEQTTLMTSALEKHNCPVTLVKLKNEGHDIRNIQNLRAALAFIENFLGEQLELPVQAIGEELIDASDFEITSGGEHLKFLRPILIKLKEHHDKLLTLITETTRLDEPKGHLIMQYMFRSHCNPNKPVNSQSNNNSGSEPLKPTTVQPMPTVIFTMNQQK